jgi:putative FmdB family regulatory protein
MPLYEYECDACRHRFEVIQKFSDAPVDTCPKCAGAVRRLLSSPAIQFKGSGWYITDYARKGAGSEGREGKDGKDSKDGKAEKGAESGGQTTATSGGDAGSGAAAGEKTKSAGSGSTGPAASPGS